jgi:hypothetical protein
MERRMGLRRLFPEGHATDETTLEYVICTLLEAFLTLCSIFAIHGLDTESPRTWIFEKDGTKVHWLCDPAMLPSIVPEARIYTYDWNAKVFDNAPVQTMLGHADNLLGLIAAERTPMDTKRPIIFVASCFGGLVLAEVCIMADIKTSANLFRLSAALLRRAVRTLLYFK